MHDSQSNNNNSTTGLYTFRTLDTASREYLCEWVIENAIPQPVASNDLHCTVVNSTTQIPAYLPNTETITISPSTFRVEMMNNALVVSFFETTLAEDYYKAVAMGATNDFVKYRPHITVAYDLPNWFSVADIKPPLLPLQLVAEECRERLINWEPDPSIGSIRNLTAVQLANFRNYLKENFIRVSEAEMKISSLQVPTDLEPFLDDLTCLTDAPTRLLLRRSLISSDNILFDLSACMRWKKLSERDSSARFSVYRVNVSSGRLLDLWQEYCLS